LTRKPAIASPAPKVAMTMRRALSDPALLGAVLEGDSWKAWRTILLAIMGEPLDDGERATFKGLTGREREPLERVEEFWGVIGRRGGKSRAAAVLAIYQAIFVDHSAAIVVGERPAVLCLAENQKQAGVVFGYICGIVESTPMLAKLVRGKTQDTLSLTNGIDITVRAASFRGLRGLTNVCVIADEAAFWYDEASGSANSDEEILAAVRPSLATTHGPLIAISSPYAKKGAVYEAWRKHYGAQGDPRILVAQGASRDFNPSLPQSVVDRAYERDSAAASAEYGGQFRSDIEQFISRELVEAAVDCGVLVRPPRPGVTYSAFADAASGAGRDSYTVGIAHSEGNAIVLDVAHEIRPPFNPQNATAEVAALIKTYGIRIVTGDKWAPGFVSEGFARHSLTYRYSEHDRSQIYLEALPLFTSGRVRLVENDRLVTQFAGLERRTSSTGRDRVDHGGGDRHDDLCNSSAGALVLAATQPKPMVFTPPFIVSGPGIMGSLAEAGIAAAGPNPFAPAYENPAIASGRY
jgi:hypothetical protein